MRAYAAPPVAGDPPLLLLLIYRAPFRSGGWTGETPEGRRTGMCAVRGRGRMPLPRIPGASANPERAARSAEGARQGVLDQPSAVVKRFLKPLLLLQAQALDKSGINVDAMRHHGAARLRECNRHTFAQQLRSARRCPPLSHEVDGGNTRARPGLTRSRPTQSANPRSRSLTLVLLRVFASTCFTITAQYSECEPSLDGNCPDTTTLYGGT